MSSGKKPYRIAVVPGDGIGKEVMPEGVRVLEAAIALGRGLSTPEAKQQLARDVLSQPLTVLYAEAAAVLGIEAPAASKRYIRALRRLRAILDAVPGFFA